MDERLLFAIECPFCGNKGMLDLRFFGLDHKPIRAVNCDDCNKKFHAEGSLEKYIKYYEPVDVEFG